MSGNTQAGNSSFYVEKNTTHRWQGDVYRTQDFSPDALPVTSEKVPFWVLTNRTCHLVEGNGRQIKLQYLVFCAAIKLKPYIKGTDSTQITKNQVKNIIHNKNEMHAFFPKSEKDDLTDHLVVDFNMTYTVSLDKCPTPDKKVVQLASPFAEHVFQRFSRWFYTVGFDNGQIKTDEFIDSVVDEIS